MSKKRQLKHTIFIACEGKNTERIYLEAIAEETETDDRFSITVYPDSQTQDPTTHALGLVKEAQSRLEDFDEVWVVFDKNGYTKHPETFAAAATPKYGKTVNIAFSSIAFEQYILLHFTKSAEDYAKSKNIIDELHVNHYFDGYSKTAYQETYAVLKDKTIVALENSAWLRHKLTNQGILPGTAIYDTNPYTDVDKLVRRLLYIEEEIIWVSPKQTINLENIEFTADVIDEKTITVNITNLGKQTFVYNADNLFNYFYLLNTDREKAYFTISNNTAFYPGNTKSFQLLTPSAMTGKHFNFVLNRYRIMMEI